MQVGERFELQFRRGVDVLEMLKVSEGRTICSVVDFEILCWNFSTIV